MQMMFSFNGYSVPDDILALVQEGRAASFCIFKKNITSPAQLRAMTDSIRQAAANGGQPAPIIGIDQEGGQLMAVANGATEFPGNMALGATRSAQLAREAGRVTARELRTMGINMNFAPTLDVNINPRNPVIGIRSFGDDPALVARLGAAMIDGIQAEGVIATAKHFPGHGDTALDSHLDAPTVSHDKTRLEEIEIAPFVTAMKVGVGAVMGAHIIYAALDDVAPATLSRKILTDLLRDELGYDGLIVTDAMDMYAVARLGAQPSVEAALRAGADMIMLGHLEGQAELDATLAHLYQPESLTRIASARQRAAAPLPFELVGAAEHQAIAQEIADRSITVVRSTDGVLPLSGDATLGIVEIKPADMTPADSSALIELKFADAIQKRRADAHRHILPFRATNDTIRAALDAVAGLDVVVVGTLTAEQDPSQASFVNALLQRGQTVIVVALRTPYDIIAFPKVETYLCAYGIRAVSMEAVARVLFGEIVATGVLPCAIPGIPTPIMGG